MARFTKEEVRFMRQPPELRCTYEAACREFSNTRAAATLRLAHATGTTARAIQDAPEVYGRVPPKELASDLGVDPAELRLCLVFIDELDDALLDTLCALKRVPDWKRLRGIMRIRDERTRKEIIAEIIAEGDAQPKPSFPTMCDQITGTEPVDRERR